MPLAFYCDIVMNGLLTGLVYGLAAVGLSLVFTVNRVVDLAHGGVMVAGMYVAAVLTVARGQDPLLAVPVVAAVLFVVGYGAQRLLVERLAAPAGETARLYAMAGLALVAAGGLALLFGARPLPAPPPVGSGGDALFLGPLELDRLRVRAALLAAMVLVLLVLFFNHARTGKAIRACADDVTGARVVGLNVERLRAVTFGLGLAVTGLAGALLAQSVEMRPTLASGYAVTGLAIALIGGLDSVGGVLLGGLAVGVAEGLAGALLAPSLKGAFGCLLAVLVLAARGRGGRV